MPHSSYAFRTELNVGFLSTGIGRSQAGALWKARVPSIETFEDCHGERIHTNSTWTYHSVVAYVQSVALSKDYAPERDVYSN